MAFIKVKIAPKIIPKKKEKESALKRISREIDEKIISDRADNLEKEKAEKKEKDRIRTIIDKYLDSLDTQLDEKESRKFWVFPDRSGFKKYKNKSIKDMQRMINKEPDKYKNRNVALFKIMPTHNIIKDTVFESTEIMLRFGITIFPIDNNGIINGKDNAYSCDGNWRYDDFQVTKFSFKLLERILELITKYKKSFTSLLGSPISYIIKELKQKGGNFDDILSPLAGV